MPRFVVNFIMTCSGTLILEAETKGQAEYLARSMGLSDLASEADTGDVEVDEVKLESGPQLRELSTVDEVMLKVQQFKP